MTQNYYVKVSLYFPAKRQIFRILIGILQQTHSTALYTKYFGVRFWKNISSRFGYVTTLMARALVQVFYSKSAG